VPSATQAVHTKIIESQGLGSDEASDSLRLLSVARCTFARLVQFHEQVSIVHVVAYSHARNALKSVLDKVVQDADVTIISRRDAEGDAVVMSLDAYYNSIMETLHLTSHPANASALARAIAQDEAGQAKVHPLIDPD
jgi:antitoxin YefM